MKRSLLRWWLGTILLGSLLTTGCQHVRQSCSTCGTSGAHVAAAPAVSKQSGYAPSVAANPSAAGGDGLPITNEAPALHTTAKPAVDPLDPASPAITRIESDHGQPGDVMRPGEVARRTFTDITAHPRFAHDPGYRWLIGTLDYSKFQNAWVLRYVSVEEDDRYGGSVTLDYSGRMSSFKSGQLVRVEGQLVNPESTELRPAYRVLSIRSSDP